LRQFVGVGHNSAFPQGDFFVSGIHNFPRLGVSKRRDVIRDGQKSAGRHRAGGEGESAVRHRTYRRRHLRFAEGSRPGAKTSASHAVPSAPGHEGVSSNTAVPAKRRSRQTSRHQQKWAPTGAHKRRFVHTSAAPKPLNRENTCPRWDSNCIPAPVNTGRPRKHKESGPIRTQYDPIRSPKCAQCTHLQS